MSKNRFLELTMPFSVVQSSLLLLAFIAPYSTPSYSAPLTQAIRVDEATNNAAIHSQKKIDVLSDKTSKMLEQYRAAIHQTRSLKTYNQYLQTLVDSQQQEKTSLQQQLAAIDTTQQEIVPLMLGMQHTLEKFVHLDLPFLPAERHQRLAKLQAMMDRADISNAEKYRHILEAYQIENDYGNTIEAYRGDLELNGVVSSVDFLRLGRVALYYQRLDGSETGYWNKETRKWQVLDIDYRQPIRKGLRIARKEAAPDLLILPVPAPEEAGE